MLFTWELIKSAFSFIKKNTWILWIVVVLGLAGTTYYYHQKSQNLDKALSVQMNNLEQYTSMLSGVTNENRILQLTVNELANTNDSIIKKMREVEKDLNIKDKELQQAIHFNASITDTMRAVISVVDTLYITNDCDFQVNLIGNSPLTKLEVIRKGIDIYAIPDISSEFDLFITSKKEYRNRRKNFFDRLFHLDFKKDIISRYHLAPTNTDIKIKDVRIIEIQQ